MSKVRDTPITHNRGGKIVRLSKSTLPPDEDLQYAVKTKPLIHIIQDEQYVS